MNTFKRIQKVVREAKVDKGRSDYGKATIRNYRHSGPDTVEPAMFDPENKRGKTIDKRREEHKSRRGKKGAKVPVHGVDEGVVKSLKKFGEYLAPTPGKGTSNEPSVANGTRTSKSTHMFKHVPSVNKDGTTGQYGKKGTTAVAQGIGNVTKSIVNNKFTKAALPVAGAVGAGLAVSKGVDSVMKLGKKKEVKEQNLDELKLFGKKDSGAIFYNDPKGRREKLQTTGKDPGSGVKKAVTNTVKNKVKSVGNTVQRSIDTQTNRAGSNIGNQISSKVKPAVSQGVSDGIKQGATAVGKAALKGTAAVGAGLAVSKGVDSLMKGGKKKEVKEQAAPTKPNNTAREIEQKGGKMVGTAIGNVITKGVKRHKKAVEDKKVKERKAVPYAALAAEHTPEGEILDERLGGKGYKSYTSLTGKKVSGDWEDSDRGAGNKAKKRAGGTVKKKSPTYQAYVLNKEGYRVLASSDGQEKPSQFAYKDEKTAKKYADSIKKGGGKATVTKEEVNTGGNFSYKDFIASADAAKKRQKEKMENRKKKSDAYVDRVRKGIKFYDAKGSGRMVKGKKVYDKK